MTLEIQFVYDVHRKIQYITQIDKVFVKCTVEPP